MKPASIKTLALAASFTALTLLATVFIKIPLPGTQDYIHMGDGVLFLAAAVLPWPYAIAVGAVGEAMADILGGYAFWAPWTFVIKAVMAFVVSHLCLKYPDSLSRVAAAMAICTLINAGGYYLAGLVIYGNPFTGLLGLPFTALQTVAGAVLYLALQRPVRRLGNNL